MSTPGAIGRGAGAMSPRGARSFARSGRMFGGKRRMLGAAGATAAGVGRSATAADDDPPMIPTFTSPNTEATNAMATPPPTTLINS